MSFPSIHVTAEPAAEPAAGPGSGSVRASAATPSAAEPVKRVAGFAARVVMNVAAVIGVIVAAVVAVALVAGVRPIVFLTGSMHPAIDAGALALTRPVAADEIRAGDIISVVREDGVRVTHRAVETVREDGRTLLVMRGDANSAVDAERYVVDGGADRVIWHADGLGTLLTSLQTPWLIAGAVALLLIAVIPGKKRAHRPGRTRVRPKGARRAEADR